MERGWALMSAAGLRPSLVIRYVTSGSPTSEKSSCSAERSCGSAESSQTLGNASVTVTLEVPSEHCFHTSDLWLRLLRDQVGVLVAVAKAGKAVI